MSLALSTEIDGLSSMGTLGRDCLTMGYFDNFDNKILNKYKKN
jgi:hypothetical protein